MGQPAPTLHRGHISHVHCAELEHHHGHSRAPKRHRHHLAAARVRDDARLEHRHDGHRFADRSGAAGSQPQEGHGCRLRLHALQLTRRAPLAAGALIALAEKIRPLARQRRIQVPLVYLLLHRLCLLRLPHCDIRPGARAALDRPGARRLAVDRGRVGLRRARLFAAQVASHIAQQAQDVRLLAARHALAQTLRCARQADQVLLCQKE